MTAILKKAVLTVVALLAMCVAASAMSQSQLPSYFNIPWANSATCGTPYTTSCYSAPVPQNSQIGIVNCAASLTDGFPPLTVVQVTSGGCGPFIQDMNGAFKQITQWDQWQGAGGTVQYNSAFSSAINGYPKGAVLQNATNPTCQWISVVDNNLSDPDTGGANWLASCPGNGVTGTSSGTNSQTVTVNPFVLQTGTTISFKAGGSNTAELFVNANSTGSIPVYRKLLSGIAATVGGEVVTGQMVTLQYDGLEWQCLSCSSTIDASGGTAVLRGTQHDCLYTNTSSAVGNEPCVVNVYVQTFSSAGTFTYTPHAGLIESKVACVGAGGAGGGTNSNTGPTQVSAGGGGGSGGYAEGIFSASTIGASQSVVIGVGGTGSSGNGNNGGNTTFGSLLTANGGSGGPEGTLGVTVIAGGANGGSASGGYTNTQGQTGYDGWGLLISGTGQLVQGGAGGSSLMGGGGTTAMVTGGSGGLGGVGASGPGGGGGGAVAGSSTGTFSGGAGGNGACTVTEFASQ